jgi:hypothetical protein
MSASPRRTSSVLLLGALIALLAVPSAAARQAEASGVDCAADSIFAEPAWHADACREAVRASAAGARVAAALPPTPFAYAHDIGPLTDNFVRHRIVDFPGQTTLGPSTMMNFGYDFDAKAQKLYALDNAGQQLGRMTLTNGAFTPIGPAVPLAGHNWSGLAFHPRTNKLFGVSTNTIVSALYTINPATGTATLINTETTAPGLIDISINCNGTMYGHDILNDSIYRIDKKTAAATLVGPTGVAANFAQGMDFDNRTGKLYVYAYLGGGANQYSTANLKTGALTPLATSNPTGEFEGATQTRCPGPQTTITKKPSKHTAKHRAAFKFKSGFAGSKFQCKLDKKKYKPCSSPFAKVVGTGSHTFRVRAKDPVGNTDATPAKWHWTVTG